MNNKDERVDAYIEKAMPFAQPILIHLRALIHKTVPEVQETIKWGMPSFDYKGPFASFASFKEHCSFGFWKAELMKDKELLLDNQGEGMGHLGKIRAKKDLPPDKQIKEWLLEAKKLNDEGIKLVKKAKGPVEEGEVHKEFAKALKANAQADLVFKAFAPGQRKEYNQWINEAKTDATRAKRIETAVEWIAEGKKRNWKYEKC